MQFDKDMKSKYSALFIQGRELLLSYRGVVETILIQWDGYLSYEDYVIWY